MQLLSTARLDMAEHCYPTPNRNHLSNRNADAAKAHSVTGGHRTVATDVRHGIRLPNGEIVWRTRSDMEHDDAYWDRANKELDKRYRAQRIAEMVEARKAQVDTWADKH